MSPEEEQKVVQLFVDGHRTGSTPSVSLHQLEAIDLATGYRIAFATQEALREETGAIKVVLRDDGLPATASPFWKSHVGYSADYIVPAGYKITGVELEIGVKLARTIRRSADLSMSEDRSAIEYYFLGIEITGTRLRDLSTSEKPPSPNQLLADQSGALAYVIGPRYAGKPDLSNRTVTFALAGQEIHRKQAAPGFTDILTPLEAYAKVAHPRLPLSAGSHVTLGALSGNVALPKGAKGLCVGKLSSGEAVSFNIA